jgi:hypothetical protein
MAALLLVFGMIAFAGCVRNLELVTNCYRVLQYHQSQSVIVLFPRAVNPRR